MAVPMFMIVSGYVYAKSFDKKNFNNFEKLYDIANLINKVVRYTIPYIVAYIIITVAAILTNKMKFDLIEIGFSFLNGGIGAGSYYYPIMIQFIFVIPVVYCLVKRYDWNGVVICGCFYFRL